MGQCMLRGWKALGFHLHHHKEEEYETAIQGWKSSQMQNCQSNPAKPMACEKEIMIIQGAENLQLFELLLNRWQATEPQADHLNPCFILLLCITDIMISETGVQIK